MKSYFWSLKMSSFKSNPQAHQHHLRLGKTWLCLSPMLCQLALSNRHHCDESGLLPSLLRAHVPEGGKADRLDSWLTGLLAGCLSEQSQSVIVVEPLAPELGAVPQAGALSTRQRAAGLVQQLSEEKVCVYCFPSGCQRHKSRKGGWQRREFLSWGTTDEVSEWTSPKRQHAWLHWSTVTPCEKQTVFSNWQFLLLKEALQRPATAESLMCNVSTNSSGTQSIGGKSCQSDFLHQLFQCGHHPLQNPRTDSQSSVRHKAWSKK